MNSAEDSLTLKNLLPEEREAAFRFLETCEDGEGYDVASPMMRRLAKLGLVKHKGGGYYKTTPLLHLLQLESESIDGCTGKDNNPMCKNCYRKKLADNGAKNLIPPVAFGGGAMRGWGCLNFIAHP